MKRIFAVIFAIVFIVGCANSNRVDRIDYNKSSLHLEIGMSKSEVQSLIGFPRRTDVSEDRERWIFWNPVIIGFTLIDNEQLAEDRLVVTFKEDKVVRWSNQSLSDDMIEASQKMLESSHKVLNDQKSSTP